MKRVLSSKTLQNLLRTTGSIYAEAILQYIHAETGVVVNTFTDGLTCLLQRGLFRLQKRAVTGMKCLYSPDVY